MLAGSEFTQQVGRENILPNVEAALKRAREITAAFSGIGPEVAAVQERMSL
ncbi:hypothetical protein [Occallatibacter riparius]|uniref:Uncharacterized protein n=1 Tax=Occallatibacter riparius TaxID=1002689 RepID=A0A9J7BKY4_9BACT|nr:hypothetical protein [Occallatibacter riparius]UWZ83540.1 hypothetical protein MOP44_23605 [Occallatibacter riparius]